VAAVLLALFGAAAWGVGDFLGGLASRRVHVLAVLAVSQAVGLAGVAIWVVASGDRLPSSGDVLAAVAAGAAGLVGLAALYRGLAVGAMGIVAPISALSPVVALTVDGIRGQSPAALQWVGIGLALTGLVLVSREPGRAGGSRRLAAGAGLAVLAALGFGFFVVCIDVAADASVPWAVACARATSVSLALLAALVMGAPLRVAAPVLPAVIAVGVFDTGANVLVALATTKGLTGVVAVLSSLYPIVTIALARITLHERLDSTRRIGAAVALSGAALVAAG
jgi:drug/metabolite transporter (DMT)-like permease